MYENESSENVAVNGAENLPDDISVGGWSVLDFDDLDDTGRVGSLLESRGDVSANAGAEQLGESVSSGDGVSDVGISYPVSDSANCSCSCGDSAPDLSALEAQADKVNGLVLLIFLFLILEWTEKKLTAIVRNMSSRRRG